MTYIPEIPPLPDRSRYDEVIASVDREFKERGTRTYINQYHRDMRGGSVNRGFMETVQTLASIIEPVERASEQYVDPTNESSKAMAQGSVAGLIVAKELHRGVLKTKHMFEALQIPINDQPDDQLEYRHQMASYLVDLGDQGLRLAGDQSADIVEDWEMEVVSDVTRQRMFRVGMGIVALAANRYHQARLNEQDLKIFEEQLVGIEDFDWNAEASKFLGDH